jgi:two-component system, response regulator YesN
MLRILIACSDALLLERIRCAFEGESDFEVCGEAKNTVEAINGAQSLHPNLIVPDRELPPRDGFEVAEALKRVTPEVQIFLVTKDHDSQEEKEAFSHGIDAAFGRSDDINQIVMNARAACGP